MIVKILKNNLCERVVQSHVFGFCVNKSYFQNKKIRQAEKSKMQFNHDQSKLKQISLNMKQLSPNFFTKMLPVKESQKIKMPNKQANAIDNSYIQMDLPLTKDQQIRFPLQRLNTKQVRIGRILQCMDSIAGIVGYRHCFGSLSTINPFILVTGSVSQINLFQPIFLDQDIKLEGYVNYVGKTSMQIQINLFQSGLLKSNAIFTMISRDANNPAKGYPCPKLLIDHLPEQQRKKAQQRYKIGQANFHKRKKQMGQSYLLKPPSPQDVQVIHKIFLNSNQRSRQGVDTQKSIVTNTRLMHVQQRNVHGKIFGGFLMRQMVETGWITASQFAQSQDIQMQDITNVYFKEPVQIGSHLRVRGRVSYTRGNILIATMQALTYKYNNTMQQKRCCELQMFFKCAKEQKKVFPRTYQNGIYYLTSRNLFHHAFPALKDKDI